MSDDADDPGDRNGAPDPFPDGVVVPITEEFDLHTFAPRDIPVAVEEYLAACREQGLYVVRLVHGRGKGVQRAVVRRLLATHPEVESYDDAPPESGGWGATLVVLRR